MNQLSLENEITALGAIYQQLSNLSGAIDATLEDHVTSIKNKATKKVEQLEKKMLRAEKNKFEIAIQQITQLKQALFPENNLQERTNNFATLYATYGQDWLQQIYQSSTGLKQEFGIIVVN